MELTPEQLQLTTIFFPRAFNRQTKVADQNTRFVHYTSAEVAFSILTKGEVWMRNAQVMNDFAEIEYGMKCLKGCYNGAIGDTFKVTLESMFPGIVGEIEKRFDDWLPHFRAETYLTCLSEHLDTEDLTGRLSMWRAYGGSSGVALVLNNTPFLASTDALGANSSPVEYLGQVEFDQAFDEVVSNIMASREVIAGLQRDHLSSIVFQMLRYAVLCTKHPGFAEEREWRVIHAPGLHPAGKVIASFESVNGIPQAVYKIPLMDWPDEGLVGMAIPAFLNRLIIGPTQLPSTLYNTFHKVLTAVGVADVEAKLCISDIPLRR